MYLQLGLILIIGVKMAKVHISFMIVLKNTEEINKIIEIFFPTN